MKILITNDDSITAGGLQNLIQLAKDYGEIKIVAPLVEQSAKSHSINIVEGISIEEYNLGIVEKTYSCDSTPADCVRAAHFALDLSFDIVFSGINNGFNVGEDISYSGTVAAAVEAVFLKKKAIAFSTNPGQPIVSQETFKTIMDFIKRNKLFDYCDLYNINIPAKAKEIKLTYQGKTNFYTQFVKKQNLWFQKGYHRYELDKNEPSDVWAINNNYISITPIKADRTNYQAFKKLVK